MDIQIHGKQIDVGDSLRAHVDGRLSEGVGKYFSQTVTGHVTFSRDGRQFKADCSLHLSSGISIQSHASHDDIYASFDRACDRLEKQLRRYKRRLKDHHHSQKEQIPALTVPDYVIASEDEAEEEEVATDLQPTIVAELTTEIKTLSVGEAVMQLELISSPFLLFKNAADNGVNIVYRRDDGNIGWIDPVASESSGGQSRVIQ